MLQESLAECIRGFRERQYEKCVDYLELALTDCTYTNGEVKDGALSYRGKPVTMEEAAALSRRAIDENKPLLIDGPGDVPESVQIETIKQCHSRSARTSILTLGVLVGQGTAFGSIRLGGRAHDAG